MSSHTEVLALVQRSLETMHVSQEKNRFIQDYRRSARAALTRLNPETQPRLLTLSVNVALAIGSGYWMNYQF